MNNEHRSHEGGKKPREQWFPPVLEGFEVTPEAAAYALRGEEGVR